MASSADYILSDNFRVTVGQKSRDYHAVLRDNSLLLKPLDFMSGKFVEIVGQRIVNCRPIPDAESGTLFTLSYLASDTALNLKVFTFSKLESTKLLAEDKHLISGGGIEVRGKSFHTITVA